jgi:hypothetical protein
MNSTSPKPRRTAIAIAIILALGAAAAAAIVYGTQPAAAAPKAMVTALQRRVMPMKKRTGMSMTKKRA